MMQVEGGFRAALLVYTPRHESKMGKFGDPIREDYAAISSWASGARTEPSSPSPPRTAR
jgi:hypothetical protein